MKQIIGLLGMSNHGKSTVAHMIQQFLPGTVTPAFSDPIKDFASYVFEFSNHSLYGGSSQRNSVFSDFVESKRWASVYGRSGYFAPEWSRKLLGTYEDSLEHIAFLRELNKWLADLKKETTTEGYSGLTPRHVLQTLGTVGRSFDEDIWARFGIRRCQDLLRSGATCTVIQDARFQNEIDLIHQVDGVVWRVERGGRPIGIADQQHESETSQLDIPDSQCDKIIQNSGSLEDLRKQVERLVQGEFKR